MDSLPPRRVKRHVPNIQ